MRFWIPLLLAVLCVVTSPIVPTHATPLPILQCDWTGRAHIAEDAGFEGYDWSLGPKSHGRCGDDGTGAWVINLARADGFVEVNGAFNLTVYFTLRSLRDGSTRSFRQYWSGKMRRCVGLSSRYTVQKFSQLLVGAGKVNMCRDFWHEALPQPIDEPVFFEWHFVSAI